MGIKRWTQNTSTSGGVSGAWATYDPVFSTPAQPSINYADVGSYTVVGKTMRMLVSYYNAGDTTGSPDYLLARLPSGYTIDTAIKPVTSPVLVASSAGIASATGLTLDGGRSYAGSTTLKAVATSTTQVAIAEFGNWSGTGNEWRWVQTSLGVGLLWFDIEVPIL